MKLLTVQALNVSPGRGVGVAPKMARPKAPAVLGLSLLLAVGCTGTPEPETEAALLTVDADSDGILDAHEGSADVDQDGLPNYQDTDSDGDSILDRIESGDAAPETFPRDSDGDGRSDFLDDDSDNNLIPDQFEAGLDPANPRDLDQDNLPDFVDPDNDGDRISDLLELGGAVPLDTDGDGLHDYLDPDSDSDLIADAHEAGDIQIGQAPPDTDGDGRADFRDLDSDGDGLTDELEAGDKDPSTAPRDTDRDGVGDFADLDSDGDSLSDEFELAQGLEPFEYDTDGDGASDGVELEAGSDARDTRALPSMTWLYVPQRAFAEGGFDFQLRIGAADIVFVLDNTGSMEDNIQSLSDEFSEVVSRVIQSVPDAAFGIATYQYYSNGSPTQKPHVMVQQLTTNLSLVQDGLDTLSAGGSSGAALESLYQSLAGQGFDQDCDRIYDSNTDVPAFIPRTTDVFGGSSLGAYDPTDGSTGTAGGMGFRPSSLPVLVYAADVVPADPDEGDSLPGQCSAPATSHPAGSSDVIEAAALMGARIIGINVDENSDVQAHMERLAIDTGSLYDKEATGDADDPLVFSASGTNALPDSIAAGIQSMVAGGSFARVELGDQGDPYGFVESTSPAYFSNVTSHTTLHFTVHFRGTVPANSDDQVFRIELTVVGDTSTRLAVTPVVVVVPGERAAGEL